MKKVSIIIVTYNSEADIFDCIASIKNNADIPIDEIELIIVDNNSKCPQPMFEQIRTIWGTDVKTIENSCNGGYGQGNNVGIRESTAPIIMIMNPDVRLIGPTFARPLIAFAIDSTLSMYGMKQMDSFDNYSQNSFGCTYMMNGYIRTIMISICNKFDWFIPKFMYFSGSCFFIRKSMFNEVGLFDDDVFMYGEEDDIHYRICKKFGYNLKYNKHISYVHLTKARKMSVATQMKYVNAALIFHKKKGMSYKTTLQHFLEINSTLLLKEKLLSIFDKSDAEYKKMLHETRTELYNKLNALDK